jgi:hypothetical protein
MKARQHLQSLDVLTPVLRAPGVSFIPIVYILIVGVSGGGRRRNAAGHARGTDTYARRCL